MKLRTPLTPVGNALALVAALFLVADLIHARQQPAPSPEQIAMTDAVPVDPAITTGRLPNGVQYFIRVNHTPEHRAELRLAVNAGSVLEDDNQRGLAHFVEHMAFEGTTHFPRQSITAFMQSLGMSVGGDVNAYTTFDETAYKLRVPTDRPGALDRSFLILEDWAHNVTFDPAGVDKERGVITEEWRLGRGASARIQDKEFPVLLAGSRYGERLPIGQMDTIHNATSADLQKFYKDWYRPDLMAVVAVGDFDKASVETLIKEHFAALSAPAAERPRPHFTVPAEPGTRFAIAADPEVTTTTVGVYAMAPAPDQTTVAAYRHDMVDRLFGSLLSSRLADVAREPQAPFLAAGVSTGLFVRTEQASSISAVVKDGGLDRSLTSLFVETDRASRFGFTQTELDRQKAIVLRTLERAAAEKDTETSDTFAAEFIRHFTTGEPIPGITYEYALNRRLLPGITLADVNALANRWQANANRVVSVTMPEKAGIASPDAATLTADIAAAGKVTLTPYVDAVSTAPLVGALPAPGTIVSTTSKDAFGITEWQLSNGVRVVLKPTTFKEDEIVFRAFGFGGLSLAPDAALVPAETAAEIVYASGAGRLTSSELQKELSGKAVRVQPFINAIDEGLAGGASRRDLETMFQLIYLRCAQPRGDPQIFGVMTSQLKTLLANQAATPEAAFATAMQSALAQDRPRGRPLALDQLDQLNLDASLAFYEARFANASDFTFVFVGSFDPAEMKPLVERYLGSLPRAHSRETFRDVGLRPPSGIVAKTVEKGLEPKSRVGIVFTGPFQSDAQHRATLLILGRVLQGQLISSLRELMGGTYGVSVTGRSEALPVPEYAITIDFTCSPDREAELVSRVFRDVATLKANGPNLHLLEDIVLALTREYETTSRQNAEVLGQISSRYELGEDVGGYFRLPALYRGVTADMVHDAANAYLNTDRYVQVTLMPAGK